MNEDEFADQDWFAEPIEIAEFPFLPLSGDEGSVIVAFRGPPTKAQSNFDEDKIEYRFKAIHWNDNWEPEDVLITESGPNFRAQLTLFTKRGTEWNVPVKISWIKRKTSKGTKFKDFTFEEITKADLSKMGEIPSDPSL